MKRTNVCLMIMLTLFTRGIYPSIWFISRRRAINSLHSREKIGAAVFVCTALISVISLLERFSLRWGGPDLEDSSTFLNLIVFVILIIESVKVARILKAHFHHELARRGLAWDGAILPKPAVPLLSIFYLQYEINRFLGIMSKSEASASAIP